MKKEEEKKGDSMERCWSDEGGLQAASLVFEHL